MPGLDNTTAAATSGALEAASPVSLTIPGAPEFFLVARMSARAVATCLDADVDQIEDLRLLIDEVCTLSGEGSTSTSRMTLTYSWDAQYLEVRCIASDVGDALEDHESRAARELSGMILEALCEDFSIEHNEHGTRSVWFRLRRPGT